MPERARRKRFDIKDGAAIVWAQRARPAGRPALGAALARDRRGARPSCGSASSSRRASRRSPPTSRLLRALKLDRRGRRLHGRRPARSAGAARARACRLAPADAAAEVRARVHWVTAGSAADAARCASSSRSSSRRRAGGTTFVDEWTSGHRHDADYVLPLLVGLVALLARPGDRQGLGALQAARRALDRPAPGARSRRTTCSASTSWWRTRSISAIEELTQAARVDADALEIHMILGNLYREKGQVGRAINVHQALLQRPEPAARSSTRTCCSASASTTSAAASSIARSRRSTRCCGSIPTNRYALVEPPEAPRGAAPVERGLRRCASSWRRSTAPRRRRAQRQTHPRVPRERASASRPRSGATAAEAARRFEAAIDLDPATVPAYLNLGDVRLRAGRRRAGDARPGSASSRSSPDRAYLAFDRLEAAYAGSRRRRSASPTCAAPDRGEPAGLARAARAGAPPRRRAAMPRDGARTAASRRWSHNPHALVVHQAIWHDAGELGSPARAGRPLRRPHARRGLLPRPAHLHALPLPQHRAALAVPALPRVEHVRRGADSRRRTTSRSGSD